MSGLAGKILGSVRPYRWRFAGALVQIFLISAFAVLEPCPLRLEIDNVLMEHPAVQQAVTFAMPSKVFGEDVAAAVVLRQGQSADESALRAFVTERLAPFKVPRKVVFLTEIPKGATGKLQRIGLAERLGVSD